MQLVEVIVEGAAALRLQCRAQYALGHKRIAVAVAADPAAHAQKGRQTTRERYARRRQAPLRGRRRSAAIRRGTYGRNRIGRWPPRRSRAAGFGAADLVCHKVSTARRSAASLARSSARVREPLSRSAKRSATSISRSIVLLRHIRRTQAHVRSVSAPREGTMAFVLARTRDAGVPPARLAAFFADAMVAARRSILVSAEADRALANPLDNVEDRLAALLAYRVPEDTAEQPDVIAQREIFVLGLDCLWVRHQPACLSAVTLRPPMQESCLVGHLAAAHDWRRHRSPGERCSVSRAREEGLRLGNDHWSEFPKPKKRAGGNFCRGLDQAVPEAASMSSSASAGGLRRPERRAVNAASAPNM